MRELLLFAMLLIQTSAPVRSGVVTGAIRSSSGMPLAGVRVALSQIPDMATMTGQQNALGATTTDASGRYRFENLLPGKYSIAAGSADRPTYYPGVAGMATAGIVTIAANATASGIDFTLLPISTPPTYIASGKVVQPLDQQRSGGSLQVNVNRTSSGGGNYSASVASDGTFEVRGLSPGAYTISLGPSSPNIIGSPSALFSILDKNVSGVELVIPRIVSIPYRTVVDGDGPVPGYSVALSGAYGTTTARMQSNVNLPTGSGTLTIPDGEQHIGVQNLVPGYFVRAIAYGSADVLKEPIRVSATELRELVVTLGVTQPPPWVRIQGYVTGPADHVSLSGNYNPGFNGAQRVPLAADGSFEFTKVPSGTYTLRAEPNNGSQGQLSIVVGAKDVVGIELQLNQRITLSGRVEVEGGAMPSRLSIVFNGPFGPVSSSASPSATGTFTMQIPEGEYSVDVRDYPLSYHLAALTYGNTNLLKDAVKIDSAHLAPLQVMMKADPVRAVSVSGHVVGYTNQPMGSSKVALVPSGGNTNSTPSTAISADGSFKFSNVPPGQYTAEFQPTLIGATYAAVRVTDGDVTGVELMVPKLVTITGQVVVEGDGPLPVVPFVLRGPAGTYNLSSDRSTQGSFSARVPYADYQFSFTAPLSSSANRAPTGLPGGYSVKSVMYGSTLLTGDQIKVVSSDAGKLVITLHVDTFKVSGHMTGVTGSSQTRGSLGKQSVTLRGERESGLPGFGVELSTDGAFEFSKVPPGTYTINLSPSVTGYISKTVSVLDRNVSGIELNIPHLVEINGKVQVEGGGALPRFSLVVDGTASLGIPDPDGMLKVDIPEGEHRIEIRDLSSSYQMKSFTYGGVDIGKTPIRISEPAQPLQAVFSAHFANVSGRVTGADLLTPELRNVVLYGSAMASNALSAIGPDGTFEFHNIASGAYTVSMNVPKTVAAIASASVRVGSADVRDVQVKVTPVVALHGRVIVEPGVPIPGFSLSLSGLVETTAIAPEFLPDGAFNATFPAGVYRFALMRLPAGYFVKSVMLGSTDLLEGTWDASRITKADIAVTLSVSSPPWVKVSGKIIGTIPAATTQSLLSTTARPSTGLAGGTPGSGFGSNGPERIILQQPQRGSSPASYESTIAPDGSFEFSRVLPGTYYLRLVPTPATLDAPNITVVDRDLTALQVVIRPVP